jgi:hypothetical protein
MVYIWAGSANKAISIPICALSTASMRRASARLSRNTQSGALRIPSRWRCGAIAYAIRATHPPDGLPWLTKIAHSMGNHAKPVKSKAPHMATIAELLELGRELLKAGAQELASGHRRGAQIFRDGLMICALATRPLRRRNFSALEIGRT